jgi:acetoacetate decarboxylase
VDKDTLYGETKYGQQEVASGSMVYKHHRLDLSQAYKFFEKPEINLKVIPSVTGTLAIDPLHR